MFALRGVAVTLSVFVLVYGGLSLAVGGSWRKLRRYTQRRPARREARLLFGLRMFPLLSAGAISMAFTVPSFILLEPRAADEPVGAAPLLLSVCGICLGIIGIANASKALLRARRAIARWTSEARPMATDAPVPVLRISGTVPPMTATGIVRPRVLLSGSAEFLLTPNELQTALNHELAHVRRRDNLKKLLLRLVAFPGMGELESAWVEASEMAADDAAVSNTHEALDLAAALLKVSRLSPMEEPVELTVALVRSPAAVMRARVERLIAWSDELPSQPRERWPWMAMSAGLIVIFVGAYGQLLAGMHAATEWLVR
jgi:Zn-dependent protease with chaperone function